MTNEKEFDIQHVGNTTGNNGIVPVGNLEIVPLLEIKNRERERLEFAKHLTKGTYGNSHIGKVGNVDMMVFMEAVHAIAERFNLKDGEPAFKIKDQPIALLDGTVVNHFKYFVELPLLNSITGLIAGYGYGVCSSTEAKYRYQGGIDVPCPDCGQKLRKSKIENKDFPEGYYYCWADKGGCGLNLSVKDDKVKDLIGGKGENLNPESQEHTILSMALKRARSNGVINLTRMGYALKSCGVDYPDEMKDDINYGTPPSNNGAQTQPKKKQEKKKEPAALVKGKSDLNRDMSNYFQRNGKLPQDILMDEYEDIFLTAFGKKDLKLIGTLEKLETARETFEKKKVQDKKLNELKANKKV